MCTSISWVNGDFYFGRTLDLEYDFGQRVVITPRNYNFSLKNEGEFKNKYALIGMATVMEEYPLYAEATNEKGLCMAGLNFPGYAHYSEAVKEKTNISPFELIPWILGSCENIKEAKKRLENINICSTPFKESVPNSPLHFIISDKNSSIVLESTTSGVKVFDNPTGVLTNSPTFDYHLLNLGNYINLNPNYVKNTFIKDLDIKTIGQGMGAVGLPGDFSPPSRFVKACFVKFNSSCDIEESASVSQFFHMLDSVSMVRGNVITNEGKCDITTYASCMNGTKGLYYYKTYNNNQISVIDMYKENLDSRKLIEFPITNTQNFNYVN